MGRAALTPAAARRSRSARTVGPTLSAGFCVSNRSSVFRVATTKQGVDPRREPLHLPYCRATGPPPNAPCRAIPAAYAFFAVDHATISRLPVSGVNGLQLHRDVSFRLRASDT
jgi:hypothetical protein